MANDGYPCSNPRCHRYIDPDFVQTVDWAPDGSGRVLIRWTCECSGDRVRAALYRLIPRLLWLTMRGQTLTLPYENTGYVQAIQENDQELNAWQAQLNSVETVDDLEAEWNRSVPPPEPSRSEF